MKLKLTQQIIIGQKHKNYASLDKLCWLSKNLYNQALYQIRQQYNKDKTYLNYFVLNKKLSDTKQVDYTSLPYVQCSQQILRLVDKINVKRDALVIEPANMRFIVNQIRLTLSQ